MFAYASEDDDGVDDEGDHDDDGDEAESECEDQFGALGVGHGRPAGGAAGQLFERAHARAHQHHEQEVRHVERHRRQHVVQEVDPQHRDPVVLVRHRDEQHSKSELELPSDDTRLPWALL